MRVIFSLIFLSLFLCSQTINEQIHALEDSTPKERVDLMNSIKEQLVSMNEEKRMQIIETLREKLHSNHSTEDEVVIDTEQVKSEHNVEMQMDRGQEHQEVTQMQDELLQQEQHQAMVSEENQRDAREPLNIPSHKINQNGGIK